MLISQSTIINFSSKFSQQLVDQSIANTMFNDFIKNFLIIKQKACYHDAEAQYQLAEIFINSNLIQLLVITALEQKFLTDSDFINMIKDAEYLSTVIEHYKQAAIQQAPIAKLYLERINASISEPIMYWLKKSAMQGFAPALNKLGEIFLKGKIITKEDLIIIPPKPLKAIKLLVLAAKQDSIPAKTTLIELVDEYLTNSYDDDIILKDMKDSHVNQDIIDSLSQKIIKEKKERALIQTILGELLLVGKLITKNEKQAAQLFKLAIEQDLPEAQNYYGELLLKGTFIPRDKIKAIKLFTLASNQNNPNANNNLGECYLSGIYDNDGNPILAKDPDKAIKLFQIAAEQGNLDAKVNLGYLHKEGFYLTKNLPKAFELFSAAAEQGSAYGQCSLGCLYLFVDDFKNTDKGIELLSLAAEQNYSAAITYLAIAYLNGFGCQPNQPLAIKLLIKAATQENCPCAQMRLAILYEAGTLSLLPKDEDKARKYYLQAAYSEPQHPEAIYRLALKFLIGELFPEDRQKGLTLLKQAVALNFAPAQRLLADEYSLLEGLTEEDEKILKWYRSSSTTSTNLLQPSMNKKPNKITQKIHVEKRNQGIVLARKYLTIALELYSKAAEKNDIVAIRRLYTLYQSGNLIISPNLIKELEYLKKAAELGEPNAQYCYAQKLLKGEGFKQDIATGIKFLTLSAKQEHCEALYTLAEKLEQGDGIEKNLSEAEKLYTLAAKKGSVPAIYKLKSKQQQEKPKVVLTQYNHKDLQEKLAPTTTINCNCDGLPTPDPKTKQLMQQLMQSLSTNKQVVLKF